MASTINYIISKQPPIIKKIAYNVIPFKWRYGKKYVEFLKLIKESKNWSYDQAKDYQLQSLKKILSIANNIPFYRERFEKNDFNIDIKNLDDLKKLPFLTKDEVNQNFANLINPFFLSKKYKMYSTGTTGKRLELFGSDDLFKIEAAFITNSFHDHGAKLYEKHSVWIRRYSPKEGDPIFFNDHELNRSYMSAFDINDKTIFSYIDYINQTKSEILVSYPSTVYYLALLCMKYDLRLKNVKYIHGASEMCLPQWRDIIFKTFGVEIKMHYGQVEKVSFAHQDLYDNQYKENLIYSFNEILEDGLLVGTGFYNEVMPLIRYKTNDLVVKNNDAILDGSTPKTIKEVLGRNGDMLITDQDSLVPAVNFYSFMSKFSEVDIFKIEQTKSTKDVNFYIVVNEKYNVKTQSALINEMKNRLGDVNINIIKVSSLDKTSNNPKFKAVSLI